MNFLNVEVSLDTYDYHCTLSDDHALYRGALCVHKSSRDSNNCQLSLPTVAEEKVSCGQFVYEKFAH